MKIYETVSKMVDISSQRIMISESQETSELDNCFTYWLDQHMQVRKLPERQERDTRGGYEQ